MTSDTYTNSYVVNFPEGDQSLERIRFTHREDINDKLYTIIEGDTLTSLAFRFYGDSKLWYIIADINENINNPLELDWGINIIIPDIQKYNI